MQKGGYISISLLHFGSLLYNIVRDYWRMWLRKKLQFPDMNHHSHDNPTEIKIIRYSMQSVLPQEDKLRNISVCCEKKLWYMYVSKN